MPQRQVLVLGGSSWSQECCDISSMSSRDWLVSRRSSVGRAVIGLLVLWCLQGQCGLEWCRLKVVDVVGGMWRRGRHLSCMWLGEGWLRWVETGEGWPLGGGRGVERAELGCDSG